MYAPAGGCCGVAVAVGGAGWDGVEEGIGSPAFGGGGIDEEPGAEAEAVAVGFGTAPGCGGGGDCVEVVVVVAGPGRVVVGVAAKVLAPTLPV